MGEINIKNKEKYKKYKKEHEDSGGKFGDNYALTELIRDAINEKSYIPYMGGGYDMDNNPILNYDVVVWFTWGHDPEFMVCMDNSDGDFGVLYHARENKLHKILK